MINTVSNPDLVLNTTKPQYKQKELHKDLKTGIWLYFLLLIFEGALRKWILPGLATPLLVIRDPIAIWLVIKCWQRGLFPTSLYAYIIVAIGIFSVFIAIFFGHGNLIVALYGARILVFHYPLIFVIGRIFTREDVIKIGLATLWITIPMAVLICLQFYSPQSAFVNRGVGGDMAGAGYDGAMGYYRPPATFSFTTGTTSYFSYAACFIFYFWFDSKRVNKLLLIAATLGLFAAIPLSISRSLFFQTGLTLVFLVLAVSRKPKYFGKLVVAILGGLVIVITLSQLNMFKTATEAFTSRFTSASGSEGGLKGTFSNRAVGGLIHSIKIAVDQPILGYGIGMGTNVGSMLLSGNRDFLIAEDEWARESGELGPILGLTVVIIRIVLALKIAIACYKKLAIDDILPWLLLSYGLQTLAEGNWAQPTYLGFYVIIGGLILASLNAPKIKKLAYP